MFTFPDDVPCVRIPTWVLDDKRLSAADQMVVLALLILGVETDEVICSPHDLVRVGRAPAARIVQTLESLKEAGLLLVNPEGDLYRIKLIRPVTEA